MKLKIRIVVEESKNNFSAYSPDVLGCVAVGDTREDIENNMREALSHHIYENLKDGLSISEIIIWDKDFNPPKKDKQNFVSNYLFQPQVIPA